MAALQLSFSLRTSAHCKTVHLLGSWDNYNGQLPLSADKKTAGGWKGTFRFQPTTLQQGQRYWYYYIIDGYHVSHDPAQSSTQEPTTGRMLNILDVPTVGATKAAKPARMSVEIPKGRPASKIISPKPQKPNQVFNIVNADFKQAPTVDELAERFAASSFESDDEYDSCPSISSGSSVSSRSSSSLGSGSDASACSCERYGITRKGDRVKLDCGGSRCGVSDDSCSEESEDEVAYSPRSTRRHAVHIRR